MKKVTRRSVFETNSSSMHSLSLQNTEEKLSGAIYIEAREYGWGYEEYDGPEERINYLYTLNFAYLNLLSKGEFEELIREVFPGVTEITYECDPHDEEAAKNDRWGGRFGWIDHQSVDLLEDEGITWQEFLRKPYRIIIDNDNG